MLTWACETPIGLCENLMQHVKLLDKSTKCVYKMSRNTICDIFTKLKWLFI
jgi:hypothetical protein